MKHTRRGLSLTVAVASVVAAVAAFGASTPTSAQSAPANTDWLGIVNTYRAQSGLAPVTENPWWSAGARNHSCWMLLNDIAHDEAPGTPGYTADGDQAGNNGNVAVSSNGTATARSHIDLWMTGPFHAIGLLRSSLTSAGFGICSSPPNPTKGRWNSGGTLDVLRGINPGIPRSPVPVVFPGNGATTSLTRFIAESPDPRTFCGWGAQTVGLPLIALMPSSVNGAIASLNGPSGPVPTCVLTRSNTSGTASAILGGDNAVVVIPSAPLAPGNYSAAVMSDGGNANWGFTVDPNAPLSVYTPPPATSKALAAESPLQSVPPFRFADSRVGQTIGYLPAGEQVRVRVAGTQGIPADTTALSANFTVTGTDGPGFLTAFNCSAERPAVATLNYGTGETVSNQALVPLDRGDLCLYSMRNAHIVMDVNGYVSAGGSLRFSPIRPERILDTRDTGMLAAWTTMTVKVTGGTSQVPVGAEAVALNLVGVTPEVDGWIRIYPCGATEPIVSSVSARAARATANSAIVPVAADGTVCLKSMMNTHAVIDVTGWFGRTSGKRFVPLEPIRLTDTRSFDVRLNPLTGGRMLAAGQVLEVQVAGVRGVPADATGATINLVALGAATPGWLRAVPCGTSTEVATLNFSTSDPIANGSNVQLSPQGRLCVVGMTTSHVVLDITGIWK